MPILDPVKHLWKKIQGHVYFEIIKWLALLAVSGVTPYLLHLIQRARNVPQLDFLNSSILGVLVFCALLLSVIFFRGTTANTGAPDLVLSLGNLVWSYRDTDDLTAIFILASLVNKGEPSVAMNWKVRYQVGTSVEQGELHNITGAYSLDVGTTRITFTNDNLLNLKTIETPIQKGQFIGGRILFTLSGDRSQQIKSIQHTITIECQDYLGKSTTATYIPSATPAKSLIGHYKEKQEAINKQEEPNSVKQPASVSSIQEPPSLGDGSS